MNLFLEACGTTGPWTLTVDGAGAPPPAGPLSFDHPFVVVGGDADADLCLPHKDVSERHALLQWLGGRLRVVDLGSRTGVLYEGRRERAGWLEPGHTIRVGPYRIGIVHGPDGPDAEGAEALPTLVLDMKVRGIRAATSQAGGALALVGSAPDCNVRLLDPAVSSYHCALVNTPRGAWVVDLLGKGGITLNGESVRSGPLNEGDELLVGRSIIRVARIAWSAAGNPDDDRPAAEPGLESAGVPGAPYGEPASADRLPEPERAFETRRSGFLSPWRRTPLPNRLVPQAAPEPAVAAHSGPEPTVAPSWSWTAAGSDSGELLEPAAPLPQWDEAERRASQTSADSEDDPELLSGPERRTSCRYPVSGRTAQLSWWEPSSSGDGGSPRAASAGSLGFRGIAAAQARAADTIGGDVAQNQGVTVTLVDVSHAGLAVLTPVVPPAVETLWFRLDDEPGLDWVEVSSVGSAPAGGGRHLLRCAFRESCPYDLFKTLVFSGSPARV